MVLRIEQTSNLWFTDNMGGDVVPAFNVAISLDDRTIVIGYIFYHAGTGFVVMEDEHEIGGKELMMACGIVEDNAFDNSHLMDYLVDAVGNEVLTLTTEILGGWKPRGSMASREVLIDKNGIIKERK